MYNQTVINYQQKQIRQDNYFRAVNAWREMQQKDRKEVLKDLNFSQNFSVRELSFLPANVREDLIDHFTHEHNKATV